MSSIMVKTFEKLLNCKITHIAFNLQIYKELTDLRMTVKPITFIIKESYYKNNVQKYSIGNEKKRKLFGVVVYSILRDIFFIHTTLIFHMFFKKK